MQYAKAVSDTGGGTRRAPLGGPPRRPGGNATPQCGLMLTPWWMAPPTTTQVPTHPRTRLQPQSTPSERRVLELAAVRRMPRGADAPGAHVRRCPTLYPPPPRSPLPVPRAPNVNTHGGRRKKGPGWKSRALPPAGATVRVRFAPACGTRVRGRRAEGALHQQRGVHGGFPERESLGKHPLTNQVLRHASVGAGGHSSGAGGRPERSRSGCRQALAPHCLNSQTQNASAGTTQRLPPIGPRAGGRDVRPVSSVFRWRLSVIGRCCAPPPTIRRSTTWHA